MGRTLTIDKGYILHFLDFKMGGFLNERGSEQAEKAKLSQEMQTQVAASLDLAKGCFDELPANGPVYKSG
jgi:hypothetical protein